MSIILTVGTGINDGGEVVGADNVNNDVNDDDGNDGNGDDLSSPPAQCSSIGGQ